MAWPFGPGQNQQQRPMFQNQQRPQLRPQMQNQNQNRQNQQQMRQQQQQSRPQPQQQNRPQMLQPRQNQQQSRPQMQQQSRPQMQQQPNAPLPDGVRMTPLDEETINMLKNAQMNQNSVAPAVKNVSAEKLEEIMQDEFNASLYYKKLADTSHRAEYGEYLRQVSSESEKRHTLFNGIYKRQTSNEFKARDADLNSNISFDAGVNLAIVEESNIISKMNDLFENTTDDKLSRALFSQICRKLGTINKLQLMCLDKNIRY